MTVLGEEQYGKEENSVCAGVRPHVVRRVSAQDFSEYCLKDAPYLSVSGFWKSFSCIRHHHKAPRSSLSFHLV